jgi:hypothetical protein
MFVSGQHEPRLPFPAISETAKFGLSATALTLRPFGLYESDLNVDFGNTLRPFLVTQILECCTRADDREEVPESFFWNLTVGKRIECLLKLSSPEEQAKMAVAFACQNAPCGQQIEFELSLDDIFTLQDEAYADEHVSVEVGEQQIGLRRPTGADQLTWLEASFANEESAARTMIGTLLLPLNAGQPVSGDFVPAQVPGIEQLLDDNDPLIDFKVEVRCPYCETERAFEIDLEDLSLRRLRQAQLRLLRSVHTLARHYHWSEQEIFSVPSWRRAQYLALIDREQNQ